VWHDFETFKSQQFQKINSKHCKVNESDWNYWPPLMVYLTANVWNLNMDTATVIKKRARPPLCLTNISRKSKHME
jgi:hypothetical protein